MAENDNDKAPTPPDDTAPVEGGSSGADEVDTSAYVGVDPIYQNYADDTLKPMTAEEGPEKYYDEAALRRQAADAERNALVGRTGYTGSSSSPTTVNTGDARVKELADAEKRRVAQERDLEKQRKQAREARLPGATA